jgi:FtsZ-binding cell division protein ZapB
MEHTFQREKDDIRARTDEFNKYLEIAQREQQCVVTSDHLRVLEMEIEEMEQEENKLQQVIQSLNDQHIKLTERSHQLRSENKQQETALQQDLQRLSITEMHHFYSCEERLATKTSNDLVKKELHFLKKFQVLNKVFDIDFVNLPDGRNIASINNLRFDFKSLKVNSNNNTAADWDVVNAAWGLASHALLVTAEIRGTRFSRYKPVPNCSTSQMVDMGVNPPVTYNLHYTSSAATAITSFEHAMTAFVVCANDIASHIGMSAALRYRIDSGMVMGVPLKIKAGSMDHLTTAVCQLFQSFRRIVDSVSTCYVKVLKD